MSFPHSPDANNHSTSYTYDAAGNLQTRTDFNGKTTAYAYDAGNRLLSKMPDASFNAPAVTYTYDRNGRRTSMIDASGWSYFQNDPLWGVSNIHRLTGYDLGYSFDKAGNLLQIAGPVTVNYTYDALNRLATVWESTSGTTSYTYDNVGNLQSVTYPNGVVHSYSYDVRNRLANLGVNGTVNGAPGPIASYAYTVDASGHRTAVTELSGRTVNYSYDNLYRLASETISCGTGIPACASGNASYVYDPVGNRTQKTSTLPGYPGGLSNYNANDELTTDTYDANGNTTASIGKGYVYDFENHLIQAGGVTYVYDGDGNCVQKVAAGATTQYTVDSRNPTGYAQVLVEWKSGVGSKYYIYGLELLDQWSYVGGVPTASYYVHDGHGSVRALTDSTGTVTDTYDYDAFGNLIHSTGTTPNNYLFAGEQFDPDLNLYYNRARYMNTSTGRFWTMDTFEGDVQSPLSLHKYLYASADPIDRVDPSGNDGDIGSLTAALSVASTIATMSNVLVAGTVSLFKGLPDAVGFGMFLAAAGETDPRTGLKLSGSGGAIGGFEIMFAPRLQQYAIYLWGGFEGAGNSGLLPFNPTFKLPHWLEVGVFAAWYWNVRDLNSSPIGIIGASVGGGIIGGEGTPGGEWGLLFGASTDFNPSLFAVAGGAWNAHQSGMSEPSMMEGVRDSELLFGAAGLIDSGTNLSGVAQLGGIAAMIINSVAVETWVGRTYGDMSSSRGLF